MTSEDLSQRTAQPDPLRFLPVVTGVGAAAIFTATKEWPMETVVASAIVVSILTSVVVAATAGGLLR